MSKNEAIREVRKLFYNFNDVKLCENKFEDNKLIKNKKNKAVISRGNLKFLEQEVIKIIREFVKRDNGEN